MPDAIHWLGIARIDRLVSMSNLKYDALIAAGIEIGERVALPPDLVPQDAMVEIEAKKAAGYFTPESEMAALGEGPPLVVGRDIKDY
jgi:GTP cyclohydrolase II